MNAMRRVALWLALAPTLALAGCVERKLEIRSEPAGARIYLNAEPRGVTPCVLPFDYYGVYEVILAMPPEIQAKTPYHRLRTTLAVKPPWYETFPLDFFAECLWPGTLRDHHVFVLRLEPVVRAGAGDVEPILKRAEELRQKSNSFHE